ncbi:RepA protein [Aeribacillus sp. FSL K6-2848]|uniref:RepA protein n=1 Tax=Aeribacillus sp. FSL K6-2848 TaxID=2954612 RepID=UPI0030FC1AC7
MAKVEFTKAKKNRNELQLPILHFVVADDWIDKLGPEAFAAWLKFYSWCDRSDQRKDKDNDVIPSSLSKVMKRLGVGKKKFYNEIIRPLWNYGLIDLVTYEDSEQPGNKPVNIVVYEYPQNDIQKKYQPLEKIRDYDTEYETSSRTFAKKGGRKQNESSDGFLQKPGVVSHGNQGWFPTETRGGFEEKPNNDSNDINNDSNDINNDSNDINNDSNHHHPLIEGFNQQQSDLIHEFLQANKIDDDDLKNKLLEKLKGKRFKYMAYIEKTFETVKKMVDSNSSEGQNIQKPTRKELVPDWLKMDYNQPKDDEDFDIEQARRELEERLKKYRRLNPKKFAASQPR